MLGFEYDTASNIQALVLWEAQYGDFANGAQVSSISSSPRPKTNGGRLRVWVCCCRTGRKGKVPSIRARASSDTCSSAPKTTCASAT